MHFNGVEGGADRNTALLNRTMHTTTKMLSTRVQYRITQWAKKIVE